MLKLIIATISVLVVGLGTQAHAAGCEPSRDEVTLFQHSKYRGACSVLAIGEYPDAKAMRIKNDSVSSIKIGANVEILVMNNSKIPRKKRFKDYVRSVVTPNSYWFREGLLIEILKRSRPSLKNTRIGNDKISAVIVRRTPRQTSSRRGACYPGSNSYSIAIYQHPDFKGNCRLLNLGTYSNSGQMNFKNDSASSVEIGPGSKVHVKLYADSNFKGRTQTLTRSSASLRTGAIGDNKLTSVKVLRNKKVPRRNQTLRKNKPFRR